MPEDFAATVETHDHRDVDGIGRRNRRRSPAARKARKCLANCIDLPPIRLCAGRVQQRHRRDKYDSSQNRTAADHLISDATCTFTILSGSVTAPPEEPGGAFFSLSITSMPWTTSPITVYWPLRLGASPNIKKNWELAVSTLSPRRAMPTMPRLKGTLENSAFRFGYFEPPVPLKFCPSPVWAMKPSITRWNGTLL